jgi:hypothetical protein
MVVVASRRQNRPNLPSVDCPLCPESIEAPEDYEVRWFKPVDPDEAASQPSALVLAIALK